MILLACHHSCNCTISSQTKSVVTLHSNQQVLAIESCPASSCFSCRWPLQPQEPEYWCSRMQHCETTGQEASGVSLVGYGCNDRPIRCTGQHSLVYCLDQSHTEFGQGQASHTSKTSLECCITACCKMVKMHLDVLNVRKECMHCRLAYLHVSSFF